MYKIEDENFPQKETFVCSYFQPSEDNHDQMSNQTGEIEGEGTHYGRREDCTTKISEILTQ